MARLLVVSRSMALAMRIADDHDVVEYPVEALEELAPEPDVEAVVLDLGEPYAAMQALDRLRSRGHDTRVLVVSGYQPAWNDVVPLSIDRVVVVPLPITRASLLDGIDRLLGVTPFVPRVPPAPSPPAGLPRATPPPGTPSHLAHDNAPGASPGASAHLSADAGGSSPALPVRPVAGSRRGSGAAPARPTDRDGSTPTPEPGGPPAAGTPGGVRRPGLARWLTTTPPRPSGAGPQGSPLDAGSAARRSAPATPPGAAEEGDLFRPVVEPQVPARSPGTLPSRPPRPAPAPPASPVPSRSAPARSAPGAGSGRPAAPAAPTPAPAAPVAPAAATTAPDRPARTLGRPERGGRGRDPRAQHPGFTPARGLEAPLTAAPVDAVTAAVATLLDRRSELFGVGETAQVLADEVIERGEADAAAVLVPDGGRWRVSGGVGLRPLERRLLLETSHWLISEIAVGGRALLIEDTDIVRPRLAGAPLAAWRHLLAVPVPSLRAAVVLARGQEAARFTEKDLAAVVPLVAEARPLLQAALRMRELARTLGPLRDLDN
jgi:hypothetical protein